MNMGGGKEANGIMQVRDKRYLITQLGSALE